MAKKIEVIDVADGVSVEAPEAVEEVVTEPVVEAVKASNVYVAVEGDSYAAIAEKLDRGSLTKFEFAKWLYDLNGGKSISEGTEVKI